MYICLHKNNRNAAKYPDSMFMFNSLWSGLKNIFSASVWSVYSFPACVPVLCMLNICYVY